MQADVEVSFEVSPAALAGAETLDPALAYDAEKLCGVKRADVRGGVGPFGLWVLASANRKERTAVFFRVFKPAAGSDKPVVLMCTDPTK
jgi:beta-fructofuranosidase